MIFSDSSANGRRPWGHYGYKESGLYPVMQNLDPNEIVDFLLEDGIIDEDNCEEVENSPTTRRKIQLLLYFIRNRKDGYASFLNALDKSSSTEHIKEKLDCTNMDEYDAANGKNFPATKWAERYRLLSFYDCNPLKSV